MEADTLIFRHPNHESNSGRAPYASFTRCNFSPNESRIVTGLRQEVSKKKKSIADSLNKLWTLVFRKLTPGDG